jgi:hypothetical protein
MTDEATPSFGLRLQLYAWDMLMGLAMCVAFGTGLKHLLIWVSALVVIGLAGRGARRLRQRVKTSPPLNLQQRRIIFACYAAPYATFVLLVSALFVYFHAATRLWVGLLFPALMAFSMIVVRYYQIIKDRDVA